MEGFARQAALGIQNARLHELELERQGFEMEMQLCAEVQRSLFPKSIPPIDGFELYGHSVPSHEVGGDYYTFVPRPDSTLDVVLADVSGKGLPAALIVSDFHTGYHLLAQLPDPMQTLLISSRTSV